MTLDKLEKLADAATPGPWELFEDGLAETPFGDTRSYGIYAGEKVWSFSFSEEEDATFIAAANPQTIKQLIALCRLQHEALHTYSWKAEHRRTSDDEYTAKEALAAYEQIMGEK